MCCFRGQSRNQNATRTEPLRVAPLLPPPPSTKRPISSDSGMMVDYLSDDTYTSKQSTPLPKPSSPPSDDYINPTATLSGDTYTSKPKPSSPPSDDYINPTTTLFATYDEPKPIDHPYVGQYGAPPHVTIPPPPSKQSQRQQFFNQNQNAYSSGGSASSDDGLVGKTQNLWLNNNSTPPKKEKPEDALFKDLVDFAKAKSSPSSSSSSSYPNRSF